MRRLWGPHPAFGAPRHPAAPRPTFACFSLFHTAAKTQSSQRTCRLLSLLKIPPMVFHPTAGGLGGQQPPARPVTCPPLKPPLQLDSAPQAIPRTPDAPTLGDRLAFPGPALSSPRPRAGHLISRGPCSPSGPPHCTPTPCGSCPVTHTPWPPCLT